MKSLTKRNALIEQQTNFDDKDGDPCSSIEQNQDSDISIQEFSQIIGQKENYPTLKPSKPTTKVFDYKNSLPQKQISERKIKLKPQDKQPSSVRITPQKKQNLLNGFQIKNLMKKQKEQQSQLNKPIQYTKQYVPILQDVSLIQINNLDDKVLHLDQISQLNNNVQSKVSIEFNNLDDFQIEYQQQPPAYQSNNERNYFSEKQLPQSEKICSIISIQEKDLFQQNQIQKTEQTQDSSKDQQETQCSLKVIQPIDLKKTIDITKQIQNNGEPAKQLETIQKNDIIIPQKKDSKQFYSNLFQIQNMHYYKKLSSHLQIDKLKTSKTQNNTPQKSLIINNSKNNEPQIKRQSTFCLHDKHNTDKMQLHKSTLNRKQSSVTQRQNIKYEVIQSQIINENQRRKSSILNSMSKIINKNAN